MSGGGFKIKASAGTGQVESFTKTTVWATYAFPALHYWPGASEDRRYLGQPHRHLFHVRVEIEVAHDDREIEFQDLRDVVAITCLQLGETRTLNLGVGPLHAQVQDLGAMSCEQIARFVHNALVDRWPGRRTLVDASEDREFGASVVSA